MTKVIKQVVSFPTFFGSSKMLHAYNVLFFTEVGFFFSSSRRHTRYWRDWSSDVCSSDLHRGARHDDRVGMEFLADADADEHPAAQPVAGIGHANARAIRQRPLRGRRVDVHHRRAKRSEERRVGKQCRARWSPGPCTHYER